MKAGPLQGRRGTTSSTAPSAPRPRRGSMQRRATAETRRPTRQQSSMIVVKNDDGRTVFWDGTDLRKRIEFARIGLDLCLSDDEIETRAPPLRLRPRSPQKDLEEHDHPQRQDPDREGRRLRQIRRPHPAHLHLRGSPRLEHRDATASARSRTFHRAPSRNTSSAASPSSASTRASSTTTSTNSPPRSIPSADLEFDFLGIQTLYDRYLIVDKTGKTARAASRRRSSSGCASPWASSCDEKSDREDRVIAPLRPLQEPPLLLAARRRSSTPARCTASSRPATSTRSTTASSRIMLRGIAENAFLSKWAGGLGGSWTAVRGTGGYIKGTNGESPGRHSVPQAAQRPARRRQPGRQAPRLRLRLPGDLAQRHRGLPRAAQEHRRRPPPHARHEHGELDSRPVHEAHGGPRRLDALPLQRSAGPPRPLRQRLRGALRRVRSSSPTQGKI